MNLSRPALLQILTAIQNSAAFAHQDILTFTGFLSLAELPGHVWSCFARLSPADKVRVLDVARAVAAN